MIESIPATVTHRYLVPLMRSYCLMLLLGDKLQCVILLAIGKGVTVLT